MNGLSFCHFQQRLTDIDVMSADMLRPAHDLLKKTVTVLDDDKC
jgi:hypothetical protein